MTRILFFGRLREAIGAYELPCPDGLRTVADVRLWLSGEYGDMIQAPDIRVAADMHFCASDTPIAGVKEIAFMSPLSGG